MKMLLKSVHQIFSYNKWSNQRLVKNISKITDEDYYKMLPIPFNNIHGVLLHLFYYDKKYFDKIVNQSKSFEAIESFSREHLAKQILCYSKKWIIWIESLMKLKQLPEFFDEILKYVIDLSTHNNYHRGQINIITSFIGYKPESLDIFVYNRYSKKKLQKAECFNPIPF